jgi:hypothetical protein
MQGAAKRIVRKLHVAARAVARSDPRRRRRRLLGATPCGFIAVPLGAWSVDKSPLQSDAVEQPESNSAVCGWDAAGGRSRTSEAMRVVFYAQPLAVLCESSSGGAQPFQVTITQRHI